MQAKHEDLINKNIGKIKTKMSFKGACLKLSAVVGITAAAAAILLSRPIVAIFAREMCYKMQPTPSYWPNPISGLWSSGWSLYVCEWAGHWGFNWQDIFSFAVNSWKGIVTSVGTVTGVYTIIRTMNKNEKELNPEEREVAAALNQLSAQDKANLITFVERRNEQGYFPSTGIDRSVEEKGEPQAILEQGSSVQEASLHKL